MARIRTHYDNLKVSEGCSHEVIRAAFRSLAAKYHPDVNPGNSEAAKTMRIINASYEVLSDPTKRAEHDRWIRTQGILEEPKDEYAEYVNQRWLQPSPTPRESPRSRPRAKTEVTSAWRRFSRFLVLMLRRSTAAVVIVVIWARQQSSETPHLPATADYDALAQKYGGNDASNFRGGTLQAVPKPLSPRPHYQRPALAPNGSPWPRSSGYLLEQSEDGNSVITVDNSRNDSDMLVKLFDHRFKRPAAVRMIFLYAHTKSSRSKTLRQAATTSDTKTLTRA